MLDVVRLLTAKRDGARLAPDDIAALVAAYTRGDVPDYQMAAFLMAAFIRGLDETESAAYTRAMLYSGEVLDLSDVEGTKVDKHSTGGVGDKVSLLLAPLVAACGVPVPMISGRGLGHTGGTLDKLEAIPGLRTDLDTDAYRQQLADIGVVMIGQTDEIAPADKKLYALRDVTGTVESLPHIAASIMSKKLAEGIDALVLDVKAGRGAFMKSTTEARRLAEALVGIGEEFDTPTVALLTRMDVPLGRAVGNGPETAEAIRALHGDAPLGGDVDDLMEITLSLAGEMIHLGRGADSAGHGRQLAEAAIRDGFAWGVMREMVDAQGGDVSVLDDPSALHGDSVATVEAPDAASAGVVTALNAYEVGLAAVALGAGRARKEDDVDPRAGFVLLKKPGESVEPGEPLAHIYATHEDQADPARLAAAFSFGETAPVPQPLVLDRLDASGWRTDGWRAV
ncbi:MAG: thymidine phosphorylase [Bacteroidota bacterium]